jgi:hypothetical protein
MEFLPLDIENIILDYKAQMEHTEKYKKVMEELLRFSVKNGHPSITLYNIVMTRIMTNYCRKKRHREQINIKLI